MESIQRVLVRLPFGTAVDECLDEDWFVSRLHGMGESECIMDDLLGKVGGQGGHAVMETLGHLV